MVETCEPQGSFMKKSVVKTKIVLKTKKRQLTFWGNYENRLKKFDTKHTGGKESINLTDLVNK